MSEPLDLAASIRANTAAVQALTALLTAQQSFYGPSVVQLATAPKVDVAKERRAVEDAAAEDEAFAAVMPAKIETAPPVESEVTLADIKKSATALAKKDREALAALVARYESDKVVNINPTFFAAFQRDVAEALA
jgi:hypothetical protein